MIRDDIIRNMQTKEKFRAKIDKEVLAKLRDYAQASGRSISDIVSEAVAEYLSRVEVRPAFRTAVDEIIGEHEDLLRELAK
jgi:predicted transcriptional regulator